MAEPPSLDQICQEHSVTTKSLDIKCTPDSLIYLSEYCVEWEMISSHLGLTTTEIDDINSSHNQTPEAKRLSFLQKWKGKFAYRATYLLIVKALCELKKCDLACELIDMLKEKKLIQQTHQDGSDFLEQPTLDQGPYRFPYLRAHCEMSSEELSQYEAKLYDDTKKMKSRFASLALCLQEDVENKNNLDHAVTIISYWKVDCAVASVSDFFRTLSNFTSFFDYDLIELLIEKLGSSTTKSELETYKEHFQEYSKRRVYECPSNSFGNVEETDKVYTLKTDRSMETFTVNDLKTLKYEVNKILGHKLMRILDVKPGCVEVAFRACEDYDYESSVTEKQKQALKALGILNISDGVYSLLSKEVTDDSSINSSIALKKLEDQLNCSICLDTYIDPKQLQCHHVYCQKCLIKLRDQQGQLNLTCPTCRRVTLVPANGVAGLQSAFNIVPILELQDFFKKLQDSSATLEGAVGGTTDLNPVKKVSLCFEHEDKELDLYCETCAKLICSHCALKGGKHQNHEYELLSKAFENYKEEITETMEKQLMTINKALAQFDVCCGEISDQRAPIELKIHDTFRRLRETLDVREAELISQLHKIIQGKLKGLAAQRDQIETTQVQLSSCLDIMKEKFKTSSHGQVLMMKTTILGKQVKELTSTFQLDILKSNTEADIIIFSASADITAVCQNYGHVLLASARPDPSKCHATIEGVEVTAIGEKSTAVLQAINFKGQPCVEPIESLECELVSDITGTRARSSIERKGESQYEFSYRPTVKGRHQLHIKIQNHHIRGSPFCVVAKSPVEKLGTPIYMIGGVKGPSGVAINQRGEVLVTEWDGHCISAFSTSGKKLWQFGTYGSGHGQFRTPCGVAVDGEGNVLVADRENHRIQKFTTKGHFLAAVGTKGEGPLKFDCPKSIAFNASNNKIYMEDGNNHIQVLNSDLTFSSIFGKEGSGKGQFRGLLCIACDSTGKVYVSDYGNHRIQAFTAEGTFLWTFGKHGVGIAIDTNGLVYVSESINNRVSVFTSEGQFVTSFGRQGNGPGEFNWPSGLAVDSSGVVYVCDIYNNRVQVF